MSQCNIPFQYWGQDSYGANNPSDTAKWQQPISYYCNDNTIDTFPIAFLDQFFATGGLPSINLANSCTNPPFPGTSIPNCTFLGPDIEACQAAGKVLTISLGGASGSAGFSNDSQAQAFAQTVWDLFLEGSSPDRPFGSAVLDGVDLDIEGGSQTGYAAFVTALRTLMASGRKQWVLVLFGASPQCPYPDAYIGTTLNAVGFDAVYVQFYNNWCGLTNFNNTNTVSPNPNVKVYIGAPASQSAAGSGYVDASTFAAIIQQTQSQYSSFGGVMLWDASQAYANSRYDKAVKNALTAGGSVVATSAGTSTAAATTTSTSGSVTTATVTSTTATTSATASATGTSCSGVPAWSSTIAYVSGDQVTYSGQLWTAKWWTYDDVPGGQFIGYNSQTRC
ncbi:glycoside hydrolase family 18 protein [Pisolithus albus]|nr:glycoside hydrolase family 18 protein [Pisolithus albus]